MSQRQRKPFARRTPVWAAVVLVALAEPAWAYLDPGTGSMIISAIVGLFATVALAVKTYWYKLKGWFRRDARRPEPATDRSNDTEARPTDAGHSSES